MRRELLEMASDLARRGEAFALATVVARSPPISAHVGDTGLVTADGNFFGWVGGSCTRPTVIAEALRALEDGRPRLVALDPDPDSRRRPGLVVFPMTCHSGGSVEIHIQPVLPLPHLVVYGTSPTARALVRLGKAFGLTVTAVDPAADAADFPDADAVLTDARAEPRAAGKAAAAATGAPAYAVVATQGQWDEDALGAVLDLEAASGMPFAYLAVMASPKRFGEMRALFAERTPRTPEDRLARIKNPAGLDLGAELPEEIALSVLAEIVKERRAAQPKRDARDAPAAKPAHAVAATPATPAAPRRLRLATAEAAAPGPGEARDPVCGMMVRIEGAAHHAVHDGRDFYFCCGGCRARFLAAPASYLGAGAPA